MDTAIRQAAERDQASLAAFHREAGRRAADRGDERAAIQELRRALYLLPYDAEAHLLLGRIYLRGGRVAEAIDTLQIAVWSHETAEAHLALAEAFLIRKDVAAAVKAIDRARVMDPEHPGLGPLQARIDEARPPG
ncbi:MAG: tetratricopeptide repeat protein [Vicinamibacteria bacterium]